jgi:hypothetical protein
MTFKYFSGFCLKDENRLFDEYIIKNDFSVAGFSFGATKAFDYVYELNKRVDTLQLFSPAFFQSSTEKFRRMQLIFFKKDENTYCNNFLKNIVYPSSTNISDYFIQDSYKDLEALLNYTWDESKLEEVIARGTKIEVYIGEKDKIIDSSLALEFFKNYATVYYIKEKGHIL